MTFKLSKIKMKFNPNNLKISKLIQTEMKEP